MVALGGGVVARRGRAALAAGALKSRAVKTAASVALAVVLLLALFTTIHFSGSPTTQAFRLPSNLSWSGYVLYHSETRIDAHGLRYYVNCYHDLGSDSMHVETVMPDHLDVIAVGNHHAMLGLDMMHHVAQWGANDWSVDETAFDLAELRSDLDAHRAVYLDQDVFQGHTVYRVRARNGLVLLLDMHYMPVNVLRGAVGTGTGEPIYDSLMLMPPSHVSSSMWNKNGCVGCGPGSLRLPGPHPTQKKLLRTAAGSEESRREATLHVFPRCCGNATGEHGNDRTYPRYSRSSKNANRQIS